APFLRLLAPKLLRGVRILGIEALLFSAGEHFLPSETVDRDQDHAGVGGNVDGRGARGSRREGGAQKDGVEHQAQRPQPPGLHAGPGMGPGPAFFESPGTRSDTLTTAPSSRL